MKLHQLIITTTFALIHATSQAGSPGGLQLLVLGTPGAIEHKPKVEQFFAAYNADPSDFDCDNRQLRIEEALQKPPKGITSDMALAAVTDAKQRKVLSKAMAKYRAPDYDRGFDGALLYDVKDGKLTFYGISALDKIGILTTALNATEWDDKSKFNLKICRALQLPVLHAP